MKAEAPQLPMIQEFTAYYETTWLVGSYPLPLWNVFENGSTRTNNHAEGWHNRLKKVVGNAHPKVFEIYSRDLHEFKGHAIIARAQGGARGAWERSSRDELRSGRVPHTVPTYAIALLATSHRLAS